MQVDSAGIAQLVEQRTENPRVRSSNLRPGIFRMNINASYLSICNCFRQCLVLWTYLNVL
jgi:hypothetical protein